MTGRVEKVLLLDGVDSVCGRILTEAGISVTTLGRTSKQELLQQVAEHDGMIVRSATRVTEEVLAASDRLRVIGRAGTGVDNIDVEAATRRGVIVMNTPGGNTLSAAEHTCAMLCSLARFLPQACASLKAGSWDRRAFLGTELYGKTLAIIGLGRIGKEVAKRMKAFGMTIVGYDPVTPKGVAEGWGVESLPLEEVWPRADYITVHTPLLPHTRNLVGREALARCKRGVRIVNVARGGIVDEEALLEALEDGSCGGVALDVFQQEPPTDLALCRHPKVVCTPHLGANTVEAQRRVATEVAQQVVDMANGRPIVGAVNAPGLSNASCEGSKPWIELAQALGCLASHLSQPEDAHPLALRVDLFGSDVGWMEAFLGPAVLVGLLKGMTQNGINLVNAPLLAEEAGVTLDLRAHPGATPAPAPCRAARALQVRVARGGKTHVLLGSSAGGQATLYALDGCVWESGLTLGRNMLFFSAPPSASPLAAIASRLLALQAAVTSLLSSAPTSKEAWHVARTDASVDLASGVSGARLVAQVTF